MHLNLKLSFSHKVNITTYIHTYVCLWLKGRESCVLTACCTPYHRMREISQRCHGDDGVLFAAAHLQLEKENNNTGECQMKIKRLWKYRHMYKNMDICMLEWDEFMLCAWKVNAALILWRLYKNKCFKILIITSRVSI